MPEQAARHGSSINQKQEAEHSAAVWGLQTLPLQTGLHTDKHSSSSFCPLQAKWEIPVTHRKTDSGLQLQNQTQLQLLHIPNLLQLWTHKEILWQVTHLVYCIPVKSTRPNPIHKGLEAVRHTRSMFASASRNAHFSLLWWNLDLLRYSCPC